jgi:hypothetical protein
MKRGEIWWEIFYMPSTSFTPSFKKQICFGLNFPTCSVKNDLSKVINWETFTTESLFRFECFFRILKLPGASAKRRLEVITTWWASMGEPRDSEQGYPRPVIIVSANDFNQSLIQTVIVVVITSNLRLADAPGNFKIHFQNTLGLMTQ